jgi:hypothetical protein
VGEVDIQTGLAEWLLACIEEDERLARSATPGPWDRLGQRVLDPSPPSTRLGVGMAVGHAAATADYNETAEHIVRWDPARVLVECDTKRRIIAAYLRPGEDPHPGQPCVNFEGQDPADRDDYDSCSRHLDAMRYRFTGDHILRLLALPYADRDGYRADLWAPDGR